MAYGDCVIPPMGYPGCYPAPPPVGGRRVVRVSVPGIQGPRGEPGTQGYSIRVCASLDAFETTALENLRPSLGAKAGDLVINSSGQIFIITGTTESTFTVGEVVGCLGVRIDDADVAVEKVWSSQKIQERLGEPVDFVKTFESELDSGI